MDRLEEFIRKNREELDRLTPSDEIWKGIKKDLGKGRSYYIRWISAAAMIAVVLMSAALYYTGERKRNEAANADYRYSVNSNQLNESEIYYNSEFNLLYRQALPVLVKYPEIEKELVNDVAHLDSLCSEIKKDLRDNISNQEVIEALINNYRLKIQILEDMLDLVKQEQQNNPPKKENYGL